MKAPLTITKICERCEQRFNIPNMRESFARELLIEFFPCPHCAYVKDIVYAKNNRSGRCADCNIPFAIIDHRAKGRCHRCYMKMMRHAPQTTEQLP